MKTTAEKIAVMQACLPDFSNLEVSNRGGWISYASQGSTTDPVWNWEFLDYRIKPLKPKEHKITMWAHLIKDKIVDDNEPDIRCVMCDTQQKDKGYEGYFGYNLLAVKPITFTITEGEGL